MKILSIVAVAVIVVAGATWAADEKSVPAGIQLGAAAQWHGKVVSMFSCNMVGMSDHTLVKLEAAPGDVEIVDLGSLAGLKTNGIEPKEGQELWIDGHIGQVNNKPILLAEMVSTSKMVPIVREGAMETSTIEGIIMDTRKVKINGEAEERMMAKVKTDNGIVVCELGCCSKMPTNVNVTVGKSIVMGGCCVGHVNGKPVMMAETIGNLGNVQRPIAPATATPDKQ